MIEDADTWGNTYQKNFEAMNGPMKPQEVAELKQKVLARKQIAFNQYSAVGRQYGGAMADVKVDQNGNPIPITQGYMSGQTPVYLPGEKAPASAPAAPTVHQRAGARRGEAIPSHRRANRAVRRGRHGTLSAWSGEAKSHSGHDH